MLDFNKTITLLGGQAFNWKQVEDKYIGFTSSSILVLSPNLEVFGDQNFDSINYFGHKTNQPELPSDENLRQALELYGDLRILNQDFEQTLLSFILTSHKNIKAVRKLISDLSEKYGIPVQTPHGEYKTFPSAEALASASEEDLRKLGCGFRSRYLLLSAQKLSSERHIYKKFRTRKEWEEYLIQFVGVGEKIRDCVLVFGLGFKDITPLDIWGKRVLVQYYGVDPKLSYNEMRMKFTEMFGESTAIVGQYLFEFIREKAQISNI